MRWTLLLVGLLTLGLAGCGDGSKGGCQGNEDCDEGQKCVDGACVVRCTCGPEEECTATAAECASDVKTDAADGDAVAPIPCTFDSDCNDGNDCTKDWCEGGFCKTRVFTAAEAVGCCTVLADCVDKSKPSASEADPDGDPCTVDSCTELHCLHEVEDPYCCHKDSDCTDENDCTQDKCVENKCLFSEPKPNCCAQDKD